MKQKRFLAVLALSLFLAIALGTPTAYAQEGSTVGIASYTIEDDDGTDVTNEPLWVGASYTVHLEISVSHDLPDTKLRLATLMDKKGDVYWHLEGDYAGVDTDVWQPGQAVIEFNAVKGTAKFEVGGSIPSDYTLEALSNGDVDAVLHIARPISLVTLSLGSEVLNEVSAEVVDQTIVTYRQLLTEKNSLLQTSDTDPTYGKLAEDVIALAEDMSASGYVQNAIDLLSIIPGSASALPSMEEYEQALAAKHSLMQSLDIEPAYEQLATRIMALGAHLSSEGYVQNAVYLFGLLPSSASDFPAPVSEKSFLPYLVVIIVLAVILIAFFAMFLRAKSSSSFIRHQVDEEAGKLDVLLVRVSRLDRQLAGDIEQVKEQLERISGR